MLSCSWLKVEMKSSNIFVTGPDKGTVGKVYKNEPFPDTINYNLLFHLIRVRQLENEFGVAAKVLA